ncbi:MAG: cyclase family protein [Planctomycetes bacterium]|nr:cyclase family protein [Planctomycetota bacterium]
MRRLGKWAIWLGLPISFCLGWMLSRGAALQVAGDEAPAVKGWTKGKGWGPWGADDEVGSLNAMTPDTVKKALGLVKSGTVYDLGIPYDSKSFRWPGHSPGTILTFRGPEGVRRQGDFKPVSDPKLNPDKIAWHSCAMFINDNVATQIDGLGHITRGQDNQWYNGFKEADWGGNFGIRKCDATTIPPIVTRGVLIDVAGFRGVEALPAHYRISVDDLQGALKKQKTELQVGDTVLIRTGTLRYWGENGADHDKLQAHDTSGIDLPAARWLVEQKGAILVGSDTSGLEHTPGKEDKQTFIPVHLYLLTKQGVHIGEFHFLEDLARDGVHEFCYVCMTNKIRGTTAGFCLRPIAIR